jgi:O-antigen/teichoic acid export membrane protein
MTSFLKKGILVSGGQILGIALGMLAGILYRRSLGPDGMGQIDVFRSTGVIAGTLAVLGLGNASIYFLNNRKVPLEEVASNGLKVGMVMGGLLTVGLLAVFVANPGYFGQIAIPAVAVFTLGAGVQVGTNMLRPLLVAQLAAKRMVSVDLLNPVVLLAGGLVLLVGRSLNPAMVLVVQGLGFFGAFVLCLAYMRGNLSLRRRFNWRLLLDLFVYGLKLAAANVLLVLAYHVTVILLRYLRRDQFADVGLYSAAVTISSLITLVPMGLGPLLYAKWSDTTGEARTRQAEMAARMSCTYGIFAAVFVAVFGKQVIWLMYGQEFLRASEALDILAPAVVLLSLFNVCNNLLAGDGRAMVTACILAGTVAIIATVTYLAVPALGIQGAALGAFCGNAFTAAASFAVCHKFYRLNPLRCLLLKKSDLVYIRQAIKL